MRRILSERNIVVLLFVLVLITFSLAHEDSKKMEKVYLGNGETAITTPPTDNTVTAVLSSTLSILPLTE